MGEDQVVEVAIVGAGVMGCSLAFHLARKGVRGIKVFDRGQIGQGATAACAGGVRAQFSSEINVRIGLKAKQVLAEFSRETGRSADYRPIGYLFLLTTAEERSAFAEQVAMQRQLGVDDVRMLGPAEAGALVPGLKTSDLSGASFCPSDGLAGPNEVTQGYAQAARRLGVQFYQGTPVEGFVDNGPRVQGVLVTDSKTGTRTEVRARQTVICAGPWSGAVGLLTGLAEAAIPIEPSRRHVFVTGPFSGITRQTPMTIDFHTSFYFHPEGEGVLFGMSDHEQAAGFDTAVDWSFLERVTAVAAGRWPPLLEARVIRAWAGLYEMTPDRQPLVGPVPGRPGLWIGAGFSGHGFMMAPVIGRWLADWIVDGEAPADIRPFEPARFLNGAGVEPELNVV